MYVLFRGYSHKLNNPCHRRFRSCGQSSHLFQNNRSRCANVRYHRLSRWSQSYAYDQERALLRSHRLYRFALCYLLRQHRVYVLLHPFWLCTRNIRASGWIYPCSRLSWACGQFLGLRHTHYNLRHRNGRMYDSSAL